MAIRLTVSGLFIVIFFITVLNFSQADYVRRLVRNTSAKLPCTTSSGVEWVRTPGNCSKYLVCGFGIPMATLGCPNSLVWSLQAKNCVQRGSRWDDCLQVSEKTKEGELREETQGRRADISDDETTTDDTVGKEELDDNEWSLVNNGNDDEGFGTEEGNSLPVNDENRLEESHVDSERNGTEGSRQSAEEDLSEHHEKTRGDARWDQDYNASAADDDVFWESSSTTTMTSAPPQRDLAEESGHLSPRPSAVSGGSWWLTVPTSAAPTTYRSPFQPWHTTRRRTIIANDDDLDQNRRRDNNHVRGENDYDESVWWHPRRTSAPTQSTTRRPWWSDEENQIPWLTQSERPDWWPRHDDISDAVSDTTISTTATSATTTPSTDSSVTSSSVDDHPASASPTVITWPPPPPEVADDDDSETDLIWREMTSRTYPEESWLSTKAYPADEKWWDSEEVPSFYPECGVAVTNLIVGGLPASEGRWPWVVSLRLTWARRHVCGGTLVHPQWIITAAHCVFGSQFEEATDWRAVFGNVQPTLTADVKLQRKIDLIIRHPEFVNSGNYPNDIAMMRLEKPVDVSGFQIRHACLPSRSKPFTSDSKCWIMGWGETKGYEEQSVLQELEVKIRRNHACAARWGWKRILNSHVCVGNGDEGACNGDSGGPLVCLRDGYYYVVGVTSWGVSGCQTTGYPSVFARVSYYEKWILDAVHTYSTVDFTLRHKSS